MSAYDVGYYFGFLLWLALGLALLLSGLQRKRRTTAARNDVIAQSYSRGLEEAPAQLPEVKGGVRVGFGIVLLVLSAMTAISSGVRAMIQRNAVAGVQIVMPSSLLGMQRHDTYFQDQLDQARSQLPSELKSAEVAWYGSPFGGVLVVAGRGDLGSPAREIDAALEGARARATVLSHERVTPATSGGAASCARIQPPKKGAYERYFCVFVDKRSIVSISDGEAATIEEAAARGRSIQHAVVVASSSHVASREPSQVSTVKITLPPTLLGGRKDPTLVDKERAALRAQMSTFTHQADLAAYQEPSGNLFLVDGLVGDMTSRASFLRQYRDSISADTGKDPGNPISVPAGAGGGDGYCWKITIDTTPTVVCALVDDESYVGIYELQSKDVAAVAAKARQIRAIVRKPS